MKNNTKCPNEKCPGKIIFDNYDKGTLDNMHDKRYCDLSDDDDIINGDIIFK